jgi:hypothetical protein
VLGIEGDFRIELELRTVNDKEMSGSGSVQTAPEGYGLKIKMTRNRCASFSLAVWEGSLWSLY